MKEIIKTVKVYECENCGCYHDNKEWISKCISCGKEICAKCELDVFGENVLCYECE